MRQGKFIKRHSDGTQRFKTLISISIAIIIVLMGVLIWLLINADPSGKLAISGMFAFVVIIIFVILITIIANRPVNK
ncbi:hypothetical protein FACS189431_3570 [Alphaproteobacteria bacterium]|nr:hypothetical protein FACS189431_3570 [Alphaproteobacteria bacterium]